MTRKFGLIALAIILAASVLGGTFGKRARNRAAASAQAVAQAPANPSDDIADDYQTAIEVVADNYAGDVDYEKATQAAIQGMLSTLDPHSMYFPRTEFQKLKEDQDSRFFGIGVTILQHRDGVYVQSAVQDTPAAKAGLRYGDRIVEVDGQDAREWTSEQVSRNVRGDRGVAVKIKVERAGSEAPLYFNIVRDAVPLPSIRNSYMIRPGTGYVGLTGGFQHTTDDELSEAITTLKAQGMRQLILDLRGNPGGLLDQAINVSSEFLARGQVVVSVRGRSDYGQPAVYKSKGNDIEDFPLVLLINRNTASASEIVAGAIQDHGRGLIVGETSFGKGLVQRVFQLPLGTGLTLTTAHYYTPYGRLIQRDYSNGSFYDYYVRHDADEETPAANAPTQPAGQPAAQPTPTPTPTPRPPSGPAVTTAAGRVFYGGGGITPDIEAKPQQITPARARIIEAAFYFTRQLAAGQIAGLENYRVEKVTYDHNPHAGEFPITDKVMEAFVNFIKRDTTQGLQPAQVEGESEFARLRLREEIITAAFNSDAGTRVLLDSDPQTLRALEALPDAKRLAETVRNGQSQS
ncbi:MAG: carboxyl-terminal processing protease [Blastocatellia bacterium]|jgi:carboxyl-terminal processing protease|nr:carboxyl-terminal processing protease [Blastocatellia bacterium]